LVVFREKILNVINEYNEICGSLLEYRAVFRNLTRGTSAPQMYMEWLKIAYLFGDRPSIASALFSRSFLRDLLKEPSPGDLGNPTIKTWGDLCAIFPRWGKIL
jgi:hypothetical protein